MRSPAAFVTTFLDARLAASSHCAHLTLAAQSPTVAFTCATRLGENGVSITVRGEVDLATAPDLEVALIDAAARGQDVLVDFSAVTFCDCSGLGVLAPIAWRMRAAGRRLKVRLGTAPNAGVVRVFVIAGLAGLLDDAASIPELATVGEGGGSLRLA